jgi:hypothetical protein
VVLGLLIKGGIDDFHIGTFDGFPDGAKAHYEVGDKIDEQQLPSGQGVVVFDIYSDEEQYDSKCNLDDRFLQSTFVMMVVMVSLFIVVVMMMFTLVVVVMMMFLFVMFVRMHAALACLFVFIVMMMVMMFVCHIF